MARSWKSRIHTTNGGKKSYTKFKTSSHPPTKPASVQQNNKLLRWQKNQVYALLKARAIEGKLQEDNFWQRLAMAPAWNSFSGDELRTKFAALMRVPMLRRYYISVCKLHKKPAYQQQASSASCKTQAEALDQHKDRSSSDSDEQGTEAELPYDWTAF